MRLLPSFPPLKQKPRPLTTEEVEHGIKITLVEGVLASIFGLLTVGTFFNALVIKMGATAHQLGLIASLGPSAIFIQLFVPRIREMVSSRRKLLLWLVILGRSLAWSVIFIPSFLPKAWWMPVMLGSIFIRSLLSQIDNNIYQDWLADLIPVERRSSYWGLRYTLSGVMGIIIPFFIGWALDRWSSFTGFQILYFIAFPIVVADMLLFLYQDEPPRQPGSKVSFKSQLDTLKFKPFRSYLLFFSLWNLLQGTMTPYTSLLMFKVYHLPYRFVSGLTILSTVTGTLLYMVWGRMQDRFGVRRVYRLILPALAFVTGLWAFVDSGNYPLYLILFGLTGALNAAMMVGGFSLMMSTFPDRNRYIYLSMNSIIMGIAGFLAPNLGAYIIDFFTDVKLPAFAFQMLPIQRLFLFGSLCSFLLALFYGKIVKPNKATPGGDSGN